MKLRSRLMLCAAMFCLAAILLAACNASTSRSYTFGVETGERIEVSCDTSGGYTFSTDDGYIIVTDRDGAQLLEGIFVLPESYEEFVNDWPLKSARTDTGASYYYAPADYGAFVFLARPAGAQAGVLFYSDADADFDACVAAFERLSFQLQ